MLLLATIRYIFILQAVLYFSLIFQNSYETKKKIDCQDWISIFIRFWNVTTWNSINSNTQHFTLSLMWQYMSNLYTYILCILPFTFLRSSTVALVCKKAFGWRNLFKTTHMEINNVWVTSCLAGDFFYIFDWYWPNLSMKLTDSPKSDCESWI